MRGGKVPGHRLNRRDAPVRELPDPGVQARLCVDVVPVVLVRVGAQLGQELGSVGCAVVRLNISLEGRVVRPGAVPQDALDRHLLGALVARALCHHARHGRVAFAVLHDVLFASL